MTRRYPFALIKEKLRARRGEVLDFAIGEQRIGLPEAVRAWIRENAMLATRPAPDMDDFRDAAANLLRTLYGLEIPPERILPTPGGRVAMTAFVACILEPLDHVLVTEPGYPAFARIAAHRHARVLCAPLDPEHGFAPDVGELADADDSSLRVIALNYPNNPTGAVLSADVTSRVRSVMQPETVLFNDAVYGPLTFDGHPQSVLGSDVLAGPGAEAVELHSFTKLFPLGPLSVSFLVGSEATMHKISTYSEFAWSPLSLLQLGATTRCLRDSQRLRAICELFAGRIGALQRTLDEIGFSSFPTPAGIYCLCRVPASIGGEAVHDAAEAADRLFEEFGLAVVPWDHPPHHYLRFCSLFSDADLARLSALGERLQLTSN